MYRLITLLAAALPAFASTLTFAEISGFGTSTISASATAFYFGGFGVDPLSISASANAAGVTLGPVRDGFIVINGTGSGESGSGNGAVGGYAFACVFTCAPAAYLGGTALPFTLGVPFQIDVSAFASSFGSGSGNISYHFSLFESVIVDPRFQPFPGASVTVYDPATVPEPATFAAVGMTLLFLLWARRRMDAGIRNP